jgi:TolB protein
MARSRTGAFDIVTDVGTQRVPGSTTYDADRQTYTVVGGGQNTWGTSDEFHLAAVRAGGDFILTVEGEFHGAGVNKHRKWGLTFRQDLAGDAVHADAAVHGDGLTSLQYRVAKGAETLEVKAPFTHADVIQLERVGASVVMRAAKRGEPLVETARVPLGFSGKVFAGIFVCSHEIALAETAVFHNFRFDVPAAEGLAGEWPGSLKKPSPSRLELLDANTGLRRIIYSSARHFEAPNWSRDGAFLLFNQEGRIHRLALDTRKPRILDTGRVKANNNDHGISFDGRRLALSSHTKQAGTKAGSQIYVVGIEGGFNYDVYAIPSQGGKERRLTTDPGLDDGPEYSPDGAFVYFNSTRSGRMKIWRMRPDGSGQEQVSFDEYHDWFAHLSPDGRRMVYVSYSPSVPAASHPRNQRVMIREQEVGSGKVRVLAYLYGGQGTMNVPSWSPDGKSVAFVSYTYGDPGI